jgi:hypothetical protein
MRHFVSVVAMMLFSSGAWAAGIDLSWNDCQSGSVIASTNRNFTCLGSTNQNYSLVFQFRSHVAIPAFVAFTAYVDLAPEVAGPLAAYWHYESGGCNRNPVSGIGFSADVLASCTEHGYQDPWGGDGTAAIAAYLPDYSRPGLGRMVLLVARGDRFPIQADNSYFAGNLVFNNRNRHVCFGCTQRANIVWEVGRLESEDGSPAIDLSIPDKGTNCVGINGATASNCGVLPVQSTSWGRLKAMFR